MAGARGGSSAGPPHPATKAAAAATTAATGATAAATGVTATATVAGDRSFKLLLGPISLQRWDQDGRGDLIVAQIWSDVRPLRGAAGLIDWRLSGRLSSLIQSGRLTGAEGEQLLVTTGGRLPWPAAMIMGLGSRVAFSTTRFRDAVHRVLVAAGGLGAHDVAVGLPGRDVESLPARLAMELVLAELGVTPNREWLRRLTILEDAAGHKQLAGLIPVEPPARSAAPAAAR
jgi:hypothetical protein